MWPKEHFLSRYSTTSGLFNADCIFLWDDRSCCLRLKPILNPLVIPVRIYSLKLVSGWLCRAFSHDFAISGVRISVIAFGRVVARFMWQLSSCKRSGVYLLASGLGDWEGPV